MVIEISLDGGQAGEKWQVQPGELAFGLGLGPRLFWNCLIVAGI